MYRTIQRFTRFFTSIITLNACRALKRYLALENQMSEINGGVQEKSVRCRNVTFGIEIGSDWPQTGQI